MPQVTPVNRKHKYENENWKVMESFLSCSSSLLPLKAALTAISMVHLSVVELCFDNELGLGLK